MDGTIRCKEEPFCPVMLRMGEAIELKVQPGVDLAQYISNQGDSSILKELLRHECLLCSVVPSEVSIANYDDQIRLLRRIGARLTEEMKQFFGLLFQANGRLYGIFGLKQEQEAGDILRQLERAICRCKELLRCDVHGVANGPWTHGSSMGRAFFNCDEIWRYYSFCEEKPALLHCRPEPKAPVGHHSWTACWGEHQKRIIAAFRREALAEIQACGDAMVSDILTWGSPIVWKSCIRALQMMNALTNELIRQDLIGMQRPEEEEAHYEASLRSIDSERDLRRLVSGELALRFQSSREYAVQKNDQLIQEVKGYIERNLSDYNLSAASLAKNFRISADALTAKFRQANQISVVEYIHVRRVARIKELLIATDMTVDRIMESAGYFSRSTMYRAFTRLTGMTPKDFRNAHSARKEEQLGELNSFTGD